MRQPWRRFALMMWAVACPLRAQEIPLSAFEQKEILYFHRAAIDLSPVGQEKLGKLLREWNKEGVWAIGIPRNHGASEQMVQGRIRTLVSALLDQGIVGVRTVTVPPLQRDAFDPILIGKLRREEVAEEVAEVDPNEDEPGGTPPPALLATKQKVPSSALATPAGPPQRPPEVFATAPWLVWSGHVAYRTYSVAKPPTVRIEARPYQVLGMEVVVAPGSFHLAAGLARTAQNVFSVKEQAEPTRQLDVSDASTNFYQKAAFTLGLRRPLLPIELSYVDEKQAVAALLPKGALVLDRAGEGWVSIVEGARYAYRTRVQSLGLDWCFGDARQEARTFLLGVYSDQIEKPFSLYEYGAFQNQILYTATYKVMGLRGRLQGDPLREGLQIDDIELKIGRSAGLELEDKYHLLGEGYSKKGFNEASLKVSPRYLVNLPRGAFARFSLALEYSFSTAAKVDVLNALGEGQLMGLYGNRLAGALKVELGWRH